MGLKHELLSGSFAITVRAVAAAVFAAMTALEQVPGREHKVAVGIERVVKVLDQRSFAGILLSAAGQGRLGRDRGAEGLNAGLNQGFETVRTIAACLTLHRHHGWIFKTPAERVGIC